MMRDLFEGERCGLLKGIYYIDAVIQNVGEKNSYLIKSSYPYMGEGLAMLFGGGGGGDFDVHHFEVLVNREDVL